MRPGELLIRHVELEQRTRALTTQIERLRAQLESDPEVDRLAGELAELKEAEQRLDLRLREAERQAETERSRMLARERELMSGRIRNPTELLQMSEEVEHMRARVSGEEEAELVLMEESEALAKQTAAKLAELEAAQTRVETAAPDVEARLQSAIDELDAVEAERSQVWAQVPAPYQAEYRRIRVQPPVALVIGGQCSACRVAVTTRGMQMLRRDDGFVHCDNCGRLLVAS